MNVDRKFVEIMMLLERCNSELDGELNLVGSTRLNLSGNDLDYAILDTSKNREWLERLGFELNSKDYPSSECLVYRYNSQPHIDVQVWSDEYLRAIIYLYEISDDNPQIYKLLCKASQHKEFAAAIWDALIYLAKEIISIQENIALL